MGEMGAIGISHGLPVLHLALADLDHGLGLLSLVTAWMRRLPRRQALGGDSLGMSQSWCALAGREVAESDGEPACRGGGVDVQQLLTGQGITRGFVGGRGFDTEEQGDRGVPMGLQHEPVAPIIPIADANRLQKGIAIAHVVPQAGPGVRPGLESDGHRRGREVMVGERDEDKRPLDTHFAAFDRERKRGETLPRTKRRGLGGLRRGYEEGTCEAKHEAERKSFHRMPSMGAQSPMGWKKPEDLCRKDALSGRDCNVGETWMECFYSGGFCHWISSSRRHLGRPSCRS